MRTNMREYVPEFYSYVNLYLMYLIIRPLFRHPHEPIRFVYTITYQYDVEYIPKTCIRAYNNIHNTWL